MRKTPCLIAALVVLGCGRLFAEERTIIVAQDGSGAFKSVTEALASVKDATKENPVTLLIKPGTYNEEVTTKDWVNLVGEDREKCIMTYTRKPEEQPHAAHVIWATSNSTLRKLTLLGGDVKYCIHSDGGAPYVLTVEDCTLRRTQDNGYHAAFGIGLWSGQHIIVRDCLLESKQPMYMHNANGQETSCSMTVERCTLKGETDAILISAKDSMQRDFFVIHDCTLTGKRQVVCLGNERADKTNCLELFGSGNTPEGGITGAVWHDDSKARMTGVEMCAKFGTRNALGRPGMRIKEAYGKVEGAVKTSTAWQPYTNVYVAGARMSDEGLILTSLTDKAFGMVIGPYGATAALPMIIEFRMKCSFAPKGFIGMQYASKPNYWNPSWRPGEIYDGGNPASVVKVNTEDWQTYRIVAKSADDVKFFVVGREAEAIALKAFKDNNWGFKLMLYEKGTQAVMTNTMVSGDVQ